MPVRPSPSRPLVAALVALLAVGFLAGCGSSGGSSDSSASGRAPTVAAPCAESKVTGAFGKPPTVVVGTNGTPTKLVTKDVIVGKGARATAGGQATLHYALYLCGDGSKVDSSFDSGQPLQATLSQGQLIDGWIQGVPGMKVGGRRVLVVPPDLGYGDQAQQGIPAGSTLLFVIDLVSVP